MIFIGTIFNGYYKRKRRFLNNFYKLLFVSSIPLFAFISLYTAIAYDGSSFYWFTANILLSGRLNISHEMINKHGFPLFGQYIELIGGQSNAIDYNYVDSSYVQAMMIWGILLSLFFIISFVAICYKAVKRRDLAILLSVFIGGMTGITSQYFIQIFACPLILALFSRHTNINLNVNYVKKRRIKKADFKSDT